MCEGRGVKSSQGDGSSIAGRQQKSCQKFSTYRCGLISQIEHLHNSKKSCTFATLSLNIMIDASIHIPFNELDALRTERDKWFDRCMEQQLYIRRLESELEQLRTQVTSLIKPLRSMDTFPAKDNYAQVIEWIEQQKQRGTDYYAEANYNRSAMCRRLSDIFGWIVDQNSLRKAQNR